jgi:hypothetical protein
MESRHLVKSEAGWKGKPVRFHSVLGRIYPNCTLRDVSGSLLGGDPVGGARPPLAQPIH